jgi:hypothetical protein
MSKKKALGHKRKRSGGAAAASPSAAVKEQTTTTVTNTTTKRKHVQQHKTAMQTATKIPIPAATTALPTTAHSK